MQYLDLVRHVYHKGVEKSDRTGTGTRSVFGFQLRYDLSLGFPLQTCKRVPFKSMAAELLWFLSGSTNVKDLQGMGCTIWDEWADEYGDLGPVYGYQWRDWYDHNKKDNIDQIKNLLSGLKNDPDSRRHIVSAWNVADLPDMALAPCHAMFQCYVANGKLSLQVYQRSADVFLGVPFNIASYALLTHMLAQQCGYEVGDLVWTGGDCHLYSNHMEQAREILNRSLKPLPMLEIKRKPVDIFSYTLEDFSVHGYDPHPTLSAPVAV